VKRGLETDDGRWTFDQKVTRENELPDVRNWPVPDIQREFILRAILPEQHAIPLSLCWICSLMSVSESLARFSGQTFSEKGDVVHSTTPTITAFKASPDRGRGLARDMRVRWALEEVGQPYDVRLLTFGEMKESAHMALHPFGQIPTYEEGDLALFETGAIVLHIAQRHAGLLPEEANARARAIMWMFAALNTLEPPLVEFGMARLLEGDKSWFAERQDLLVERAHNRLSQLSARLGAADWLDGGFTAGDLMMAGVLFRSKGTGLLDAHPNLAAYVARAEARPAFKCAFAAQLEVFVSSQRPTG
jgi:glutathione S-transferase